MSAVVFTPRSNRRADERRIRDVCSVVSRDDTTLFRTPALADHDARWFAERGFVEVQSLVMLRRETMPFLGSYAASLTEQGATASLMRCTWRKLTARRNDAVLSALLTLDETAFPAPWHMTKDSLARACRATDDHDVIIANAATCSRDAHDGSITGFALVGRTARSAYLQRLAVNPAARRRGIASILVRNCLAWAHSEEADELFVNTEPTNDPALALYRKLGFVTEPDRLRVFERETSQ